MKDERIRLTLKKRLESLFAGEFQSREKETRGYDFSELKPMRLGNDPRGLDLRSYALRKDFLLRIREPDRAANVYLLLDASRSTSFGSGKTTKWEVELEIAALIARASLTGMNRVGLILFEERVRSFELAGGETAADTLKILSKEKPEGHSSNLRGALHTLAGLAEEYQTRPSVIFIISDFLFEPDYETLLAGFSARNDIIAFIVKDEREIEFRTPRFGIVSFKDLETDGIRHSRSPTDFHEKLPKILKRHDVDYLFLNPGDTPQKRLKSIIEFFESKTARI